MKRRVASAVIVVMFAWLPACTSNVSGTTDSPGTAWSDDGDAKADDAGPPAPHSAHQYPDLDAAGATAASIDVMVETMPDEGFQFFAMELDFGPTTWAHAGLQSGAKADWGGLALYDYGTYEGHELEVLEQMQNAPSRVSDVAWSTGAWYHYDIAQDGQETLPAGYYSVLDEAPSYVDHPRTLYEWDFTVTATDGTVVWEQPFYVNADRFLGWSYWTETGYGETCADVLTSHWKSPSFIGTTTGLASPTRINRSIGQSTCPLAMTSDISAEDVADQGTVEHFGAPRAANSFDGEWLYVMAGPIGVEYYALGGTLSPLGFPTSLSLVLQCGSGRTRLFQNGQIVASTGGAGYAIIGEIALEWATNGGECSPLGLPIADATTTGQVTTQPFVGGVITWDLSTNTVTTTLN